MTDSPLHHQPVLLAETLDILSPKEGDRILDCTVGLGGHASAFLERIGSAGSLIGLDADEANLLLAKERIGSDPRVTLLHADFRCIRELSLGSFDIIFADIGLSSPHLDDAGRGFSFQREGPLDMRFDRSMGIDVRALIRKSESDALAEIFRKYGELFRDAVPIARRIAGSDLPTTTALKDAVESVTRWRTPKILPQVFQALRIAVNDELGALQILLSAAPQMLNPSGKFGVISFHSLEDRLVKHSFKARTERERDPITGQMIGVESFELLTKKPLRPGATECAVNPRARSALLRVLRAC
jgi:16S rRNA (cytosine1402-N4)-methyltransferase